MSHPRPINQITLYRPYDPLLYAYAVRLKGKVLQERDIYQRKTDQAEFIVDSLFKKFPDLMRQIKDLKGRIRLRTKGAPATESYTEPDSVNINHQEGVAHAFLVKKAYRAAAKLAHPDKGGSHEDFAAVSAAYKAGDLQALNEFVISYHHKLIEQIQHWTNETKRPEINWRRFQSSEGFRVVRWFMTGQHDKAHDHARLLLELTVISLLNEESNL